ncbi:hypothetical protein OQA88_10555 [Cercophora sp. LCS_1]
MAWRGDTSFPARSPSSSFSIPMEQQDGVDLSRSRSPLHHGQYIARIRDCFRCFPRAASFYQPLIDYLSKAKQTGLTGLQIPVSYLLRQKPNGRDASPDHLTRHLTTSSHGGHTKTQRTPRRSSTAPPASPGLPEQQQSQITVVEGFLAPETIGVLGKKHRVRPEFFINHLAPLNKTCAHQHGTGLGDVHRHERPDILGNTVPSSRENMIHVRFLSMLEMPSHDGGWSIPSFKTKAAQVAHTFSASPSVAQHRVSMQAKLCLYEQWLFNRHYGATRFRALHVHNDRCITVEQMISFTVTGERDGTWHGLFLLDSGRQCDDFDLPWADLIGKGDDTGGSAADFVPLIPYNISVPQSVSAHQGAGHSPYHPKLDIESALSSGSVEAQLLAEDPFYILGCVYRAAAQSYIQLLAFTESDVIECMATATRESQRNLPAFEQLRFNLQLVRRVERYCQENLTNINQLGSASWPRAERLDEIHTIRDKLQQDYGYLLKRCKDLARQCEGASNASVSWAQLMESREGIRESHNVTNLSFLAIFFIPLNYVSSLFSMNVTNIADGVAMWIWGVTSGVAVLLTFIVLLLLKKWKWLRL